MNSPTAEPVLNEPSAALTYLRAVIEMLESVSESPAIEAAAQAIAATLARGGWVHTFGSGHSHLMAEEIFYRAGGLVRVNPILIDSLMLHAGAADSSLAERTPGLAQQLLTEHPICAGDTVIVASNSGGNRVGVEVAELSAQAGATVIALTNLAHATSATARTSQGPRLHDVADVVLDNQGVPGDAVISVEGIVPKVAPTSTAVGAAILQAVVARAVQILAAGGQDVEVFASSNQAGGDEANATFIARYRDQVKSL